MTTESDFDPPLLTHKTLTYHFIMAVVHPTYRVFYRPTVRGREHLLPTGGVLVAANHVSFLDIPLLAKVLSPRHAAFVARDTLARARWLAFVMRQCGAVLVERGKGDRAVLRRMTGHLECGDQVVIFPEGTRSADGRLAPFKKGALIAARMAGVPIVPCGIRGTFEAWPRDRKWPRPGKVFVDFGAPIDSSRADALDVVRQRIAELSGQVLVEATAG